jgi:hypothetical protein
MTHARLAVLTVVTTVHCDVTQYNPMDISATFWKIKVTWCHFSESCNIKYLQLNPQNP